MVTLLVAETRGFGERTCLVTVSGVLVVEPGFLVSRSMFLAVALGEMYLASNLEPASPRGSFATVHAKLSHPFHILLGELACPLLVICRTQHREWLW